MKTISANVNNTIPNVDQNDIYLDAENNLSLSFDLQAALESCAETAKTILGEMIFNVDQGIPYFETVWVGSPNITQFVAALRSALLRVPNVTEIISLIPAVNSGILSYSALIRTTFGVTSLVGTITEFLTSGSLVDA